jgi:phosphohistidine phosphatase SixA
MKNIKWLNGFIVVLLLGLFAACTNHSNPDKTRSVFYVVRHAERHPGFNGHLDWYGRLRAGDLMRFLKDSGIQKAYVTPFSRTWETADSLILLQKIDTVMYIADTSGASLVQNLKAHKDYGRKILIIGHSNTVPAILRKLGASYPSKDLPSGVFNLMFEVINDHGKVKMRTLHYGRPNWRDTVNMMIDSSRMQE